VGPETGPMPGPLLPRAAGSSGCPAVIPAEPGLAPGIAPLKVSRGCLLGFPEPGFCPPAGGGAPGEEAARGVARGLPPWKRRWPRIPDSSSGRQDAGTTGSFHGTHSGSSGGLALGLVWAAAGAAGTASRAVPHWERPPREGPHRQPALQGPLRLPGIPGPATSGQRRPGGARGTRGAASCGTSFSRLHFSPPGPGFPTRLPHPCHGEGAGACLLESFEVERWTFPSHLRTLDANLAATSRCPNPLSLLSLRETRRVTCATATGTGPPGLSPHRSCPPLSANAFAAGSPGGVKVARRGTTALPRLQPSIDAIPGEVETRVDFSAGRGFAAVFPLRCTTPTVPPPVPRRCLKTPLPS
jgi:hypothetical protein